MFSQEFSGEKKTANKVCEMFAIEDSAVLNQTRKKKFQKRVLYDNYCNFSSLLNLKYVVTNVSHILSKEFKCKLFGDLPFHFKGTKLLY